MVRSFFASVIILLSFALFESAVLSNVNFLPAVPDFMLICTIYFASNNGKLYGVSNGFVSGLFLDFLSAAPMGLHCLVRTIIGYVCGLFNRTLNMNGIFIPALVGAFATLAKALTIWILSAVFPISVNHYTLFSSNFLFEVVANAVLTPLMFKFLGIFKNTLLIDTEKVA